MEIQSSFRNLLVWQKSMDFAEAVYKTAHTFPQSEQFGLTSQLQRAVISIPSNIAEGSGRGGAKEFAQFISIAIGSASETETQIELAHRIGYITKEHFDSLLDRSIEIKKMLVALRRSIVR